MASISITNKGLSYGIPVEDIFWVQHNILTKEQIRESRDEEIIADILAYMLLNDPPSSSTEFFDEYYGIGNDDPSLRRFRDVETAIQRRSVEFVIKDFEQVFDQIRVVLADSGPTLGRLLFDQQPARAPRYFQAVFLAFVTLIVKENRTISNSKRLIGMMTNQAPSIPVPEGGRWSGEARHNTVQAVQVSTERRLRQQTTRIPPQFTGLQGSRIFSLNP
jgi:hypothetical protein